MPRSGQSPWPHHRIAWHAGVLELEGMLQDDRLKDHDRLALAASAAQLICNPAFGSEIFTAQSGVREV
jgi:hypothetical protein